MNKKLLEKTVDPRVQKQEYRKPFLEELGSLSAVTRKTGPDPDQAVPALTQPFGD